jgi:regulator of RNase E activity RraB
VSISEPDRQVLEQLAANGDNPAIPRPVVHFFYAASREPLDELANSLEGAGWNEIELGKGAEDFRLLATKTCDLLDGTVESLMAEVEQAVGDLEIDYDGWETSVELSN